MKQIPALIIVAAALASLFVYFSGFGRLFVSYAPTIPPEMIAAARDRGYTEIIAGTLAIALSSFFAGIIYPRYKLYSVVSFTILALALLGALIFFVVA